MKKHLILGNVKDDLKNLLEKINEEDFFNQYEKWRKNIEQYLDFIDSLKNLPEVHPNSSFRQMEQKVEKVITQATSQEPNLEKEYRFERKLRGGILPEFQTESYKNGYFIPEKMIRNLNLMDGDYLKPVYKYQDAKRGTLYEFEVGRRGNGNDVPNRCEFQHEIVKKDPIGRMYVELHTEDEDLPQMCLLGMQDVSAFGIAMGDVIDVAFWKNRSREVRVIWRHDTPEISTNHSESDSPEKPTHKNKMESVEKKKVKIQGTELLTNKKILVIGGAPREPELQKTFLEFGAQCTQIDGDQSQIRMSSIIKKVDIVVIVTGILGHGGSKNAVVICKENKIPFDSVQKTGLANIVRASIRALTKKQQENEEENSEENII